MPSDESEELNEEDEPTHYVTPLEEAGWDAEVGAACRAINPLYDYEGEGVYDEYDPYDSVTAGGYDWNPSNLLDSFDDDYEDWFSPLPRWQRLKLTVESWFYHWYHRILIKVGLEEELPF